MQKNIGIERFQLFLSLYSSGVSPVTFLKTAPNFIQGKLVIRRIEIIYHKLQSTNLEKGMLYSKCGMEKRR